MLIVLTFVLNAGLNFLLGLAVAAALGPAEYGRFAVASMVAIVLGTAAFDWLRLSATRYYTERARVDDPALRATLDSGYLFLTGLIVAAAVVVLGLRLKLGLTAGLLAGAVAVAVSNARFEFMAALARARFLDRTYGRLVIGKNVAAFALAIGTALWFKDAAWVMAGLAASSLLAILPARAMLADAGTAERVPLQTGRLRAFARYGVPIVAANVIYQVIVLANRGVAAAHLGFAEAGQLSLATDMSIRLLLAIGAALDVYLFQLVVRRDAADGRAAAHRQIIRNMLVVAAILVLLAVGYATAMPAFEAMVVPLKFRGDFGAVSLVLLPGILGFCLVNFGLNPVFQLGHRTGPVVWAALAALVCDLAGLAMLVRLGETMPAANGVLAYAAVHTASLLVGCGFACVLAFRDAACRPPLRDLAAIALAGMAAALAIWPTRSWSTPVLSLAGAALFGTIAYAAVLCWFDVAGLRTLVQDRLRGPGRWKSLHQAGTHA